MANDTRRISHSRLIEFIAAAYRAVGIPEADAAKAAELMAASDISGADGHGVFRLPQYIRRIKAGGLNIKPEIKVIRRARATALVDGDNGLGSLVVARAVEEAIGLARDNGLGGAGLARANRPGAANGADVVDFNKNDVTPTNTGQAICVIDIKAFAEPLAFKRQVDAVIRQLHGSALLPGFERIRLPGEDRHRRIEERRAHGIPIPRELRAALDKMAADLGIPPLFG